MRVVGLVPARGGSKGIPRKNLALLCGRPLLAYTCEAALASRLDRTIVSTDDPEIADAARACGVDVPFMRPAALGGDEVPMVDVVRHAFTELAAAGDRPDAIVILQPTSPLRGTRHIDTAIERLFETGADTVVTVVRVPHQFTPGSLMTKREDRLTPYANGPAVLRRQDKPELYARNGPAVLAVRAGSIQRGGFYDGVVIGVEMDPVESLDVDSADDLALAEFWLTRRGLAAPKGTGR